MRSFKSLNNLVGWLVFAIAAATYLLTLEPTASFWDCGEFIACSYKLLVPHPPGAPTFLLLGRLVDGRSMHDGVLADVAPTLLELAGLPRWAEMTGRSLLDAAAALTGDPVIASVAGRTEDLDS